MAVDVDPIQHWGVGVDGGDEAEWGRGRESGVGVGDIKAFERVSVREADGR